MILRRAPLAALLALAAFGLACPGTQPPQPPPAPATATANPADEKPGKDTLVIGTQADFDNLISPVEQTAADGALNDNLYLGLTRSEFNCRIQYLPALAESWEQPDDGLSITFHLRKDLKWSDGQPITADDVKFTYDLVADPNVASERLPYVENMKPDARPRVLDPYTVRFEFTHAYDRITQMSHCSLDIMPKHALENVPRGSLRTADFNRNPITSGAWKIAKWEKNQTLEIVPNEMYVGPEPPPAKLSRIIFKVTPDPSTRILELENGSVDMLENLQTMEDIERIESEHPEIKVYRRGWRFLDYIGWNLKDPLFSDKNVRRALTKAIDRQKIIKDLLTLSNGDSMGVEAVSTISPELCDYKNDSITPIPFNPEEAKADLAAAGWKDSDGDGILDKNGKPFRFTLATNSGNARRAKAVIIVQQNLRAVGVDAQIASIESNAFFENLRKRDFQAALAGWSAGLFVDPSDVWHSDEPNKRREFNHCSYSNARVDELIEKGLQTPKLEDQAPIWKEMQQIIYDDQPYTFLYWKDEAVPLSARVKDAKVDIGAYINELSRWWVPESQVKYKQQ